MKFKDMALQATLQTESKPPYVAVVTRACSTSTVWPSVLIVTLCGEAGTHRCGDTHAGLLETWAQVPDGHQSLSGQVLQPVPSTLQLTSALAADEPSLNQPWEPHTMLRLLGITSLKSILAAPQDWAGKRDLLLLLISLFKQIFKAGVRSPITAFIVLHQEVSHGAGSFLPSQNFPVPTGAEQPPGQILWPADCFPKPAPAAHWPMAPSCLAQGNVQDICMLAGGTDWRKLVSAQQLPVLPPGI